MRKEVVRNRDLMKRLDGLTTIFMVQDHLGNLPYGVSNAVKAILRAVGYDPKVDSELLDISKYDPEEIKEYIRLSEKYEGRCTFSNPNEVIKAITLVVFSFRKAKVELFPPDVKLSGVLEEANTHAILTIKALRESQSPSTRHRYDG